MNILIVEDEPIIARRIRRMVIEALKEQINQIEVQHSLFGALAYLEKNDIDLLLLDLNLHGMDGFSLLESMVAASFHTIIISAYKNQALRAFEYGVLDFVPKPFNQERIDQALRRLGNLEMPESQIRFLSVQKRGRYELYEVANLSYVKGAGSYTELFFQNGNKEIHNKNLEKLGQLLPLHFVRIHKSYIVNLKSVQTLEAASGSKYTARLKDGTELPVGRTRYKLLKERWTI